MCSPHKQTCRLPQKLRKRAVSGQKLFRRRARKPCLRAWPLNMAEKITDAKLIGVVDMALADLTQFTNNIREQIASGKLESAFDQLEHYLQSGSPELRNELILHIARYKRLLKENRQGTLTEDQFQVEQAKLERRVLQFLDEMPKQIREADTPIIKMAAEPAKITLLGDTSLEQIIGANNLKQISWLQQGLQVSSGVCRILTPSGMGTGFLIGPNLIMTNNHVISDESTAAQSVAEFNYQSDISGNSLPSYRYRLKSEPFHTSPLDALDYTIVGIEPNPSYPSLDKWGQLRLDPNYLPIPSEHVTIVQHPDGGPKQIALTANQVFGVEPPRIFYTTDTMPGSSGSPVFNDNWQVVAIHHAFGGLRNDKKGNDRYVNEGILMSNIKSDAGNLWPQ
jgi:V8-like Glu-specific endopeptidase